MINNQIKVLDLDGMIIRTKSFTADLEVSDSSKNGKELSISLSPSGKKIYSADYEQQDGLSVLIERLETAAVKTSDEKYSEILIEVSDRIRVI